MAEKILNTRIQLKYDTYENWTTKNPVLKKGEMAIATIATGDTQKVNSVTPPQVLIKVGDGKTNYNALPFASGLAADVYSWAKAASKPSYKASEITGLTEYIGGVDTDTQYQLVKDDAKSNANQNVYKLQSKSKNGTFSDITGLPDITVKTDAGINSLIDAAITALNLANTYEAKGAADTAKSAVIGKASDTAEAETIYGAKAYAKDYTDQKISEIPAQTDYTVTVDTSETTAGALKSYAIKQLGETVATIDIPKDYLVKSASCKTATEADKPITGLKKGDPYLDFVINTKDTEAGSGTEEHVYINVANLVDVYTAEDGINIRDNKVSVKLDTSNANGLSVDSAGLKLAVASGTNNGAMSSTSYTDLQTAKTDIDALKKVGATKVEKSDTNGNIKINGAETTVYTHPATHAASEITGLADIATTGNVNDLVQTTGDVLVFDCGNATI